MPISKIDYNIKQNWTFSFDNVVGTSTDTVHRGEARLIRPESNQGVKNDAQTIYLDPIYGNDINSGFTINLAKRTIEGARVALISSGRLVIHVDTLALNVASLNVVCGLYGAYIDIGANNLKIQVAPGIVATVIIDGLYVTNGSGKLYQFHGLDISHDKPFEPRDIPGFNGIYGFIFNDLGSQTYVFDYCSVTLFSIRISGYLQVNNSVVRRLLNTAIDLRWLFYSGGSIALSASESIFITIDTSSTLFLIASGVANRCNFIGFNYIFDTDIPSSSSIHSSIIDRCYKVCEVPPFASSKALIQNSLINLSGTDNYIDTVDPNNIIDRLPLFINPVTDFRLQHRAITAESGFNYLVSSPCVSLPFADVSRNNKGAMRATYTRSGETKDVITLDHDGCGDVTYSSIEFKINRVNFNSAVKVNGKYINTFDGCYKYFRLELDGRYFVGTDFVHKLSDLIYDNGLKRFYPQGDYGIPIGKGIGYSNGDQFTFDLTDNDNRTPIVRNTFTGWVVYAYYPKLLIAEDNTQRIYKTSFTGSNLGNIPYINFEPNPIITKGIHQGTNGDIFITGEESGILWLWVVNSVGGLISKSNLASIGLVNVLSIFADSNGYWVIADDELYGRVLLRLSELLDVVTLYQINKDINEVDLKHFTWDYNGEIICHGGDGTFYYYDYYNHKLIKKVSTLLSNVKGLACTIANEIWVCDGLSIVKMDKTGSLLSSFDLLGINPLATDIKAVAVSILYDGHGVINQHDNNTFSGLILRGSGYPVSPLEIYIHVAYLPCMLDMDSLESTTETFSDYDLSNYINLGKHDKQDEQYHSREIILAEAEEEPYV